MDTNIHQKIICVLNGVLVGYKANMASNMTPGEGLGTLGVCTFPLVFGLGDLLGGLGAQEGLKI